MNFLNHETEVDFVVTLAIDSSYPSPLFGQRESHVIKPQFFSRLPESQVGTVYQAFNAILQFLPRAETSPENARNWYARGSGHEGHQRLPMQSSANDVKVSARWLLELLAGRTTVEEAFRQYNIDPQSKSNPFRKMLDGGRLPDGVTVMRNEDADDSTIALRFGPPDAAIAPFRIPPTSGDSVQR